MWFFESEPRHNLFELPPECSPLVTLPYHAVTVEVEPKDPEVIWEAWGAPADICHATHRNRSMALNLTTPIAGRGPPPHTRQNPEATDWPLNVHAIFNFLSPPPFNYLQTRMS